MGKTSKIRYAVWVYPLADIEGYWLQTGTPDDVRDFGYATLYHSEKRARLAAEKNSYYQSTVMTGVPREDWFKIVEVDCQFIAPPPKRV